MAERCAKWVIADFLDLPGRPTCVLDAADGILAALHSAGYVVERGWSSDMDAAPKDGSRFLARLPDQPWESNRVVVARWDDDRYAKRPRPYFTNDREGYSGITVTRKEQPEAWRPLPAPPAAETEGEG